MSPRQPSLHPLAYKTSSDQNKHEELIVRVDEPARSSLLMLADGKVFIQGRVWLPVAYAACEPRD